MKVGEDENRQLSRILRAQIHHVLDRELRSEAFMDEVRRRPGHTTNGNGVVDRKSDIATTEKNSSES
jgi:hypothetical protein